MGGARVALLGHGSPFGETALLQGEKRMASIRALSYCDVYRLSKADFDQLRERYPDFDAQVKEVVAARLRDTQEKTSPNRRLAKLAACLRGRALPSSAARSVFTSSGMKNEAAIWNTKHRAQAPTLIQSMALPSEERTAISPASRGLTAAPIESKKLNTAVGRGAHLRHGHVVHAGHHVGRGDGHEQGGEPQQQAELQLVGHRGLQREQPGKSRPGPPRWRSPAGARGCCA